VLHVLTSLFFQEVAVVSTGKAHESQKQVHAPLDADVSRTAVLDDTTLGYRGPAACRAAGVTYRQLDYWARTGLVRPSIRGAKGSGSQRLYSFKDILVLKIVKGLLDTGISLQNIRLAVDKLRDRGVSDIAEITLVSDGVTVYECRSNEEIIDLLGGGQGVFGIAVPQIMKELTGTISAFPSERVTEDDADNVIGFDELADRRRRKTS